MLSTEVGDHDEGNDHVQTTNKIILQYQQTIAHAKIYIMGYTVWILPADVRTNNQPTNTHSNINNRLPMLKYM